MKRKEGLFIQEIRRAVQDGRLAEPFNSVDVLKAAWRLPNAPFNIRKARYLAFTFCLRLRGNDSTFALDRAFCSAWRSSSSSSSSAFRAAFAARSAFSCSCRERSAAMSGAAIFVHPHEFDPRSHGSTGPGRVHTNGLSNDILHGWNRPKLNMNALRRFSRCNGVTCESRTCKCSMPSRMSPIGVASGGDYRRGLGVALC